MQNKAKDRVAQASEITMFGPHWSPRWHKSLRDAQDPNGKWDLKLIRREMCLKEAGPQPEVAKQVTHLLIHAKTKF